MGGEPLTALNLLAVPIDELPKTTIAAMLEGGSEIMAHAGTAILGGHSIDDPEPKMGYAVTGFIDPHHIWRNNTAEVGDVIFLTKAIGTGVIIKAIKDGVASPTDTEAAIQMMTTVNKAAKDAIQATGDPSACTDVTGFGLLGHLWEMASSAGLAFTIDAKTVPTLPGSYALALKDRFPSGSRKNFNYVKPHVDIQTDDLAKVHLMADAVTAGGLLFTVSEHQASDVIESFAASSTPLYQIGRVSSGPPRLIIH